MSSKLSSSFQRTPPLHVKYHHSSGTDEILRPTLMTVSDGRCYRKLTEVSFGPRTRDGGPTEQLRTYYHDDAEIQSGGEPREVEPAYKQPLFTDDVYDEGEDTTVKLEGLEEIPSGGYSLKVTIPQAFFKYVIGQGGRTKSNIEKETKCRIKVPGRGKLGPIVVEGQSVSSVADAKRRLEVIAWANKVKEPVTHFVSIPLNLPTVMEKFNTFKSEVLVTCKEDFGISDELFQVQEKLHLTLGVMRLFNAKEEDKAKDILKECVKEASVHLGSEPAVISLCGVECMKDDPSAVDVLYAKVNLTDSSPRLQLFADTISQLFQTKAPDLMSKEFERDGVKLHATLMNSYFRAKQSIAASMRTGGSGKSTCRYFKKEPFDATKIFKDFGEFNFGEVFLQVVHLSKRGELGPDGFYRCVEEITLTDF